MKGNRFICGGAAKHWVLAMSFVLLGAGTASAEVVATGNLDAVADYRFSIDASLAGTTFTWDNANYSVFGEWDVNLGAELGINDMWTVNGEATPSFPGTPPFGFFSGDWSSASPGILNLSIYGNGQIICPNSVGTCASERQPPFYDFDVFYESPVLLSGSFVDAGSGTLPTEIDGVPVTYAVDGSESCQEVSAGLFHCTGNVNLNAFKAVNTEPGGTPGDPDDSVTVPIVTTYTNPDTGQVIPVNLTVTYDQVGGDGGYTNVVTASQSGGNIDPNFSVDIPGFFPVFLEITATPPEAVSGPITICGYYPDVDSDGIVDTTAAHECDLRFLHNDDPPPDDFVDRTMEADDVLCPFDQVQTTCGNNLCINTVINQICASVDSLSTFFVAVYVGNDAPVIETLDVAPVPEAVGEAVTATGTFCDADLGQDINIQFDWGDDEVSQIVTVAEECDQVVEASHSYAEAGVYTVTMTVTDADGASDSQVLEFAVIYDPAGGFVTGGGWIDSPEGAYTPDPTLTGKANFGFNSKYKKGAGLPTGNTTFRLKAADLKLESTSYQWMVIAARTAQVRGEATINGDGNYGFKLTVIDGEGADGIDRFRMQIWDQDNADATVYDSQMGDDDSADVTTTLGGGSIVVHTAK